PPPLRPDGRRRRRRPEHHLRRRKPPHHPPDRRQRRSRRLPPPRPLPPHNQPLRPTPSRLPPSRPDRRRQHRRNPPRLLSPGRRLRGLLQHALAHRPRNDVPRHVSPRPPLGGPPPRCKPATRHLPSLPPGRRRRDPARPPPAPTLRRPSLRLRRFIDPRRLHV